ncbi:MAG: hypothetical protein EA364_14495 [Balneolaceae bacterium]|nr:MAG: hypothetical protein EA364_14495 [Balneolaceae bacterium]
MPESGFLQFKRLIDEMHQTDHPSPDRISDYTFFTDLVRYATQCEPGAWYSTDILSCDRSMRDMQPCEVQTRRSEKPDKIRWECRKCRLSGVISQFEGSMFDSRFTSDDDQIFSPSGMNAMLDETALVEIRMPEKAYSVLKEVLETGQTGNSAVLDNIAGFMNNEVNLALPLPLAMMMMNSMKLYLKEVGKHRHTIEMLLNLFEQYSMKAHIGVIAGYLRGEHTASKVGRLLGYEDQNAHKELEDLRFALERQADEENIGFNKVVDRFVTDQMNTNPDIFQQTIGGLSTMQIAYLNSQDNWMQDAVGISINYSELEPDTIQSLPFMMNVRLFYKHLLESGGKLPMGRDGRFKPETIRYLIDNGVWPEYSLEWRHQNRNKSGAGNSPGKPFTDSPNAGRPATGQSGKVLQFRDLTADEQIDELNSIVFQFIEELASVMILSGLFAIKKGKCIPVRHNADLLMTRNSPRLYALLLQTLFLEYDMAYRFGDESIADLLSHAQENVTYTLYQLHRMKGRQMVSSKKLTNRLLHPDIINGVNFAEDPEQSEIPQILREYICFSIYLEPLSRFGLVELVSSDPALHSFTYKARKTPLFDSLITFGF